MEPEPKMQDGKEPGADFAGESFEEIIEVVTEIDDPKELCECVFSALESILRDESERPQLNALSESVGEIIGDLPFDGPPDILQAAVRSAAHACITLLRTAHESRQPHTGQDHLGTDAAPREQAEGYYFLPPHLAHLLKRLDYTSPPLPEPTKNFETFQQLYETAILHKIDGVLIFFQKKNESIIRELPPPFILSPAFATNLKYAIETLIFPFIGNSRQLRILAPGVDWTKIDTQAFWSDSSTKLIRRKILQLWMRAWDDLKLITSAGADGLNIVQIKESTKLLRALLAPASPGDYDLPRITNREILIFESLLETPIDWQDSMTVIWRRCQDLYEQEKDPRIFQQKAREGAFRDGILSAFKEFPEQWSDFLVLLCHYVFPRVSTEFLERFSASLGTSDADRERRMPFLMRYLRHVRITPAIKARELKEEEELKKQALELKNFLTGRTMKME